MKKLILLGAVAMLAACNTKEAPPADNAVVADDMNVAADANVAAGATMTLLGSSWEFTREGKPIQESIDSNGNYIAVSGAEHIDHGTYAQVDGKQCFTSAMTKEGSGLLDCPGANGNRQQRRDYKRQGRKADRHAGRVRSAQM